MEDRRRSPRLPARFDLVFDDGHRFEVGSIENISDEGLFLATEIALPLGTRVTLAIEDPDRTTRLAATVARTTAGGATSTPGMGLAVDTERPLRELIGHASRIAVMLPEAPARGVDDRAHGHGCDCCHEDGTE